MLFHLRDGFGNSAKGEVRVHSNRGQLLCISLGNQHMVTLWLKKTEQFLVTFFPHQIALLTYFLTYWWLGETKIFYIVFHHLWNSRRNKVKTKSFYFQQYILCGVTLKSTHMMFFALLVLSGCVFCAAHCFSVTWMKWMWSSVRESCVSSLSLLFRSVISWPRRSMWPSAVLSAAFLLVEMSLAISCCILSMERSMSPNSFSLSCKARCAELWKSNYNQYSISNSASFSFLEIHNF